MRRAAAGILLLAAAAHAAPAEREVTARISYLAPGGFYVDAGSEQGLAVADRGTVRTAAGEVVQAEVVAVSATSARLELLGAAAAALAPGDVVRFSVPERGTQTDEAPETRRPEENGEFVPLLERQRKLAEASSRRNVGHGRVALRQLFQTASDAAFEYVSTRVSTSGGIDRLGGDRWAVRWSGNLTFFGGDTFEDTVLDGVRLDLFELTLQRRLDGEGHWQAGRFVPRALPGAGTLDGALLESGAGEGLRVGAALGFKPDRFDLAPRADEPTALLYATWERGERGSRLWTGSAGVLASLFDGEADRAALLVDQRYTAGGFSVNAGVEVDFDVGAAQVRDGTRLTRLDVYASQELGRSFTLRAGVDHWERLDNAAERDALGADGTGVDPALFDFGFWRSWIGGRARLPGRLRLDAEVAVVDTPDADEEVQWRATLTRQGLLAEPAAHLSLTAYNLAGAGVSGFGGQLDAFLPLAGGRWTLQPALGFRAFEDGRDLTATDVRLHAEYRPPGRWSFQAGVAHLFGDPVDTTTFELGLRYRW